MPMTGFPSLLWGRVGKTTAVVLTSALLLSGCVPSVNVFPGSDVPPVDTAIAPPESLIDPTLYAAKSDGKFNIPALPVEQIPEAYRRQTVSYISNEAPGTIIIDPTQKFLYYVLDGSNAIRYGISVGAEGFQWSGTSIVANKRQWPTWTPPAAMIERKPSLEKWRNGQPGGPTNPLGSRAIYLTSNGVDYGYRIHGTPEWKTIGRNASSGCFRMINQDVIDLYDRVQGGEKVVVLTSKGEYPTKLSIPPSPKPKKAAQTTEPSVETLAPVDVTPLSPATEANAGVTADPNANTALTPDSTASDVTTQTPATRSVSVGTVTDDGAAVAPAVPVAPSLQGNQTAITLPAAPNAVTPNAGASTLPAAVSPNATVAPSTTPSAAPPAVIPPGAVCFGEACPTQ